MVCVCVSMQAEWWCLRAQVFSMMQDEEEAKTPLQERMDNLGKYLSYMSFGGGCVTAALP